jgi:hypothetical protein
MECVLFIQTLKRWGSKVKHRLDFELNCLEVNCRKPHAKFIGQN